MIAPEKLAKLPRDTKRENELSAELRSLTDLEKWEYIKAALDADPVSVLPTGLVIARRIALEKQYLINILKLSIERGNPSSMEAYLNAVLAGLGYNSVVTFFKGHIESNPEQVAMAIYHLPNMSLTASESEVVQISLLRKRFCDFVRHLEVGSAYLESCLRRYES